MLTTDAQSTLDLYKWSQFVNLRKTHLWSWAEAQDRERRLVKQNWYAQCRISARENCYSPRSHDKLKRQEHIQKLRGKHFADLKECAETSWIWEGNYTVHWYSHCDILVWYWTSWQLNHLNGRKRWRPYKSRAELYSKSTKNSHWYCKQSFEYSTVKLWNTIELLPSIRMLNAPVPSMQILG